MAEMGRAAVSDSVSRLAVLNVTEVETAVERFRARVHLSTAAEGTGFRRYQVRSVRGTEQPQIRKSRTQAQYVEIDEK
jgi:hypothetical protein